MTEVIKRDGTRESLNIEKLHKVVTFACEEIAGVSASEVEIHSQIQFFDGIKTEDVQETLIKSAADLISEETPNYQWVAGRLINYHLRKMVYGQYEPISLRELVEKNIVMMAWPEAISLTRFLLEKTAVSEQLKQTLLLKLAEALLFDGQLDSALNELDMLQIFSEQLASPEEKIHLLNLLSLTLTRRQNFDDAILHAELAYQAAQQANNERLIIQSLFINFFASFSVLKVFN